MSAPSVPVGKDLVVVAGPFQGENRAVAGLDVAGLLVGELAFEVAGKEG